MFPDTFIYNRDANNRMIESILAAADPTQKILQLASHILVAHRIWLTRIISPADSAAMNPWLEIPPNEFAAMNEQLHLDTQKMLEAPGILDRQIPYINTKGESYRNSVQEIAMHLLLHSAYHRGQVAQLLRANGGEPAVTDYIFYKWMLGD